jgi:hypothetical protein
LQGESVALGGHRQQYARIHSIPQLLPPPEEWQIEARSLIGQCQARLFSEDGAKALAWLHARGLSDRIIREAKLGYLPGKWYQWHKFDQFTIPSGILIPWSLGDEVWAIKVRLSGGDQKYKQASGGCIRGAFYWAHDSMAAFPLLVTEGEFDCLIALQEGGEYLCPASVASASTTVAPRWYPVFWAASRVYVCFDADQAGDEGAQRFIDEACPGAVRVTVPVGKDITDFHLSAGPGAVASWLKSLADAARANAYAPTWQPPSTAGHSSLFASGAEQKSVPVAPGSQIDLIPETRYV